MIGKTLFTLYQPPDDPSSLYFRYLCSCDVVADVQAGTAKQQMKSEEEGQEDDGDGDDGDGIVVEEKKKQLADYFQLSFSMDEAWNRLASNISLSLSLSVCVCVCVCVRVCDVVSVREEKRREEK